MSAEPGERRDAVRSRSAPGRPGPRPPRLARICRRGVVHDHRGRTHGRRFGGQLAPEQGLQPALQREIDRAAQHGAGGGRARQPGAEHRRQARRRVAHHRGRSPGQRHPVRPRRRQRSRRAQPGHQPVRRPHRRREMPVRPAPRRRLRDRHQQRRLRLGQLRRPMAEPRQARRPHALDVAAERRKREIHRKDRVLAVAFLQLPGAQDVVQLAGQAARMRLQQARRLHAQRGPARHDPAHAHILPRRPRERARIHAAMRAEMPVFGSHQQSEITRVHVGHAGVQAPHAVRGEGAQELAVRG